MPEDAIRNDNNSGKEMIFKPQTSFIDYEKQKHVARSTNHILDDKINSHAAKMII